MKLLIADDEFQIRTGLAESIEWNSYGISEVFTAENGIEALEIAEIQKPEIVLTDIRMPGVDGIELGKKISQMYEPVVVIIISGYSEFEYAKEALKFGAFDYLLKPIHIEELTRKVQEAQKMIETKKGWNENAVIVENMKIKKSLKDLLFAKQSLSDEECIIFFECFEFTLDRKNIVMVVQSDSANLHQREQMAVYLENRWMQEPIFKKWHILFREQDQIVLVTQIFSEMEYSRRIQELKDKMKEENQILMNQFDDTASLGISKCGEMKSIPFLFENSMELLKHRLYLGKNQVIINEMVEPASTFLVSPVQSHYIHDSISAFDYAFMKKYLQNLFEELKEKQIHSVHMVKGVCLELKNILISVVAERGVDIQKILDNNQVLIDETPDYCTLEEYHQWIDNIYYLILQGLSAVSGKQHSRAIVLAVDYMSRNYANDINLEIVAEYVNKSKNYFSYLFKKETGVSFVEYLNQVRINKAKQLLDTTDEMTYEISEKVGYKDYKYFSSIFKKLTGMSPAQYRKRTKNSIES